MLNFSNFKAVTTANTRDNSHLVPRKQNFQFKYKKFKVTKDEVVTLQTAFTISNDLFAKLNLADKNRGLIELINEGKSYLAIVDNDHAVFLKTTKKNEKGVKGKNFKSSLLEQSLSEQGVIDTNAVGVNQKLELVLVEGSETAVVGEGKDAIQTSGIYEIVKSADANDSDEDDATEAAVTPVEVQPTEVETVDAPQGAAPEVPASTTGADEDDF